MKILNSKNILSMLVFIGVLMTGNIAFAQAETTSNSNDPTTLLAVSFVIVVLLTVLAVAMYLLSILTALVKQEDMKRAKAKGVEYVEPQGMFSRWYQSLTGAVPIENEASIILDHEYDGIRELDNHLPPWWSWMFIFSIIFAVVYWFLYETSGILPSQAEEYEIEMAAAEAAKATAAESGPQFDEANIVFSDDPAVLASGKKVYDMNCIACHKADGGGGIGPNLTDEYWIHGGSIQDIYTTVSDGVPDKGMLAWKDLLSPTKMNAVTSYIHTMNGTNPEGGKAAQGEKYEASEAATPEASAEMSFADDGATLAKGKKVYDMNCIACHKANGEGGIGPNLTDEYWIHGGSNQNIYTTIKEGVPDKGMLAWKELLSEDQMKDVTSFLVTFKGTNAAGGKAAEGDKYEE